MLGVLCVNLVFVVGLVLRLLCFVVRVVGYDCCVALIFVFVIVCLFDLGSLCF